MMGLEQGIFNSFIINSFALKYYVIQGCTLDFTAY